MTDVRIDEKKENSGVETMPPEEATDMSSLPASWEQALRTGDAVRCHALAAQAGAERDTRAVYALCRLVEAPPDAWQMPGNGRKTWRWARVAALTALARIGAIEALPFLINALFDPDPHIRETAAFEVPTFGAKAVPCLREVLREAPDWSLVGMQAVINILGKLGDTSATGEMVHVLAEQLPGDPARWARQTFAQPFYIVLALFLSAWTLAFAAVAPDASIPLWQNWLETGITIGVGCFVPFLFLYMLLVCGVFLPLLNLRAARERGELARAALGALARIGDKRPLPLVIDMAFGTRPFLARAARIALLPLLSKLQPDDADRLTTRTKQQLAQALGGGEAEMDHALLYALERIGSGQAVPQVERLAQYGATSDLRDQARHLLPLLRERLHRETASASLLRPSQSRTASSETLLRGVEPPTTMPMEQLLRPTGIGGTVSNG
jgi:HEAT repeat protein